MHAEEFHKVDKATFVIPPAIKKNKCLLGKIVIMFKIVRVIITT